MYKNIQICLGPFSLIFAYWFMSSVVPELNPATRNAIENGGLGMLIGLFGGAAIFVCCQKSWVVLSSVTSKKKHPKS